MFVNYEEHFKDVASEIDTREEVDKILLVDAIKKTLSTLNERERVVLTLRFFRKLTLEKTGRFFNISRERTRQVELKALRKLRWHKRRKNLTEFWDPYPGCSLEKELKEKKEHEEELKEQQRKHRGIAPGRRKNLRPFPLLCCATEARGSPASMRASMDWRQITGLKRGKS